MRFTRAALVGLLYFGLTLLLDGWGLPSAERATFYPADASVRLVRGGSEGFYVTGPSKSFHPDEASILGALASMKPAQQDFNPHFFNYPSLQIYAVGGALALGQKLGWVKPSRDPAHYLAHPEDAAMLYRLGRAVSGLWAALALGALVFASGAGLVAALLIGFAPLFLACACSLTVDMASAGLATVAVLVCASLKGPRRGPSFWAGVLCGLAASAKYPGGLALLPLLLVCLGPGEKRKDRMGTLCLALVGAAAGFLAGTPYALLSPTEFWNGLHAELLHSREAQGFQFMAADPAWKYHLRHTLQAGCGIPFTLFLTGILGSLMDLGPRRRALLFYLAAGVALLLTSRLYFARYALPFLPVAAVVAAEGWALLLERAGGFGEFLMRFGSAGALATQFAVGAVYAVIMAVGPDPRLEAAREISMLPPGKQVRLLERPYFTTPPLDSRRLPVSVGLVTPDTLGARTPDLLVASEFELRDLARQGASLPAEAQLAAELMSPEKPLLVGAHAWKATVFHRPAGLAGFELPTIEEPQELVMLHPTVYLWRRIR